MIGQSDDARVQAPLASGSDSPALMRVWVGFKNERSHRPATVIPPGL